MKLPENWQEYSHLEQAKWFLKYAVKYQREGEIRGLLEDIEPEVKEAYEKFLNAGGYNF
ncbi:MULTISPECIES: hypothetical protein [Terrabacteria group]|uniref:hypothetical protein n=1 Tax=Bacillati TaxID=1783272 RepID=UPI00193A1196|nr:MULTISPECIES: hypothetical protein [Terrabacteria group]MBW9212085.1 hypothetical protein [Trueperella sp. zg.1013]QRG87109.1 hypothetical protein JOS54_02030 [Bulleidia sp. zg-1006]